MRAETQANIEKIRKSLTLLGQRMDIETAAKKELEALLDGEADGNDAFLEINAGAGGTEACDWAQMLARMYVRWAESRGF